MPPKRRRGDAEPDSHIGFLDAADKDTPRPRRRPAADDLDLDRIW